MQTETQHRWGKPIPGAGPQKICTVCGARATKDSLDGMHPAAACSGVPTYATGFDVNVDYDPLP